MSEQETELDKLKRENDELRSLVRRAFSMVRTSIEREILDGGVNAASGMGVANEARKWMRSAREAGCATQGRPLRGGKERV